MLPGSGDGALPAANAVARHFLGGHPTVQPRRPRRTRASSARTLSLAHRQACLPVTMAGFTVSAVLFDMDGPSSSRD